MRYVIYGAGAVGSSIGAGLHEAGLPVLLIARGAHLERMTAEGLMFESHGRKRRLNIPVAGSLQDADIGDGDTVFLCMKSQDTQAALGDLASAAVTNVNLVCAQNGVENERVVLRRFKDVYGLVVRIPAEFTEPGHVSNRARPSAGILDIGRYPRGTDDVAGRIARDLTSAGFSSRVEEDVMRWKYGKLLENLGTPVDALFPPSAQKDAIMSLVREEARATLAHAGIDSPSDQEKTERRKGAMDYDARKDKGRAGGSIWQSLVRATGSVEVDFMNGEIVLLGRLTGMKTPANEAVQELMHALVRGEGTPRGLDATAFLERLKEQSDR